MGLYRSIGICTGLYGSKQIYRDLDKPIWVYKDLCGSMQTYMGLRRSLWV